MLQTAKTGTKTKPNTKKSFEFSVCVFIFYFCLLFIEFRANGNILFTFAQAYFSLLFSKVYNFL